MSALLRRNAKVIIDLVSLHSAATIEPREREREREREEGREGEKKSIKIKETHAIARKAPYNAPSGRYYRIKSNVAAPRRETKLQPIACTDKCHS
jgi:hypothetical protein